MHEALTRAAWEAQLSDGLEAQATGNPSALIPYWMKEGMIHYFAHGWVLAAEDQLLGVIGESGIDSWDALIAKQPALGGQAFCYFLSRQYFSTIPAQLFQQFRKRKPLVRALRLVTQTPADSLFLQCYEFYKARGAALNITGKETSLSIDQMAIRHKPSRILHVVANSRQTLVAYTLSGWHRRTVYIYDRTAKQSHKVYTYALPPWIGNHQDDPYPLVEWSASADELLLTLPVKGILSIRRYRSSGTFREAYPLPGIDGIGTLVQRDYNNYLLGAWRKGQSDIVNYNLPKDKYFAYTHDHYDDWQPVFDEQTTEVFFASRRPLTMDKKDSVLWKGIFKSDGKEIIPVRVDTGTYSAWDMPMLTAGKRLLGVTSINGRAQYALLSSRGGASVGLEQPGPSYEPSQLLSASDEVLTRRATNDSLFIRKQKFGDWFSAAQYPGKLSPWLVDYRSMEAERAKEDSLLKAAVDTSRSFLSGVLDSRSSRAKSEKRRDSLAALMRYDPKKATPYILQLYSAYFAAKVNNDYFINRYQPFQSYQGQFKFPELGGMAQGGFSDLFENHHFKIAFRLPAGTEGSDFFIDYKNTAKKLDWGLSYFRKNEDLKPDPLRRWIDENGKPYPNAAKVKTNYYELNLGYPVTYFSSVGLSLAARQDKTVFLATERYSLDFAAFKSLWTILTLSYAVNKLQPTLPMLYRGFSGRVSADVFKGFTQQEEALGGLSVNVSWHRPLYKYITLVLQGHAGYSGGDHSVLYNLGGVDNNVTPRVDSTVHFAQDAPYDFQTLITPLRGYYQNSVYGSRYALINADVYFPLFQSLIPLETPLSFLNNLQLGLFTDLASAGGKPRYSTSGKGWQNAYGFSARSTLAGYPLRFDMGWPGSFSRSPVWYLSLSVK